MTVCVAAIANNDMIVGASDRMLSTSEIAFEPGSRKVSILTTAIFAMTSGDAAVQAEILAGVRSDIDSYLAGDNVEWLTVEAVVDRYVFHWQKLLRKRSEAALLSPLGLTTDSFLATQSTMDKGVVDRLTNALFGFQIPYASCIITGVDATGPHIWVVENGASRCEDSVGFASIGAGKRHADSQMMTGTHSPARTTIETVVLIHLAKKRAEIAPSVGEATDLFLIGPALGTNAFLSEPHLARLDRAFDRLRKAELKALGRAQTEFGSYLSSLMAQPASSQQEAA